MQEAWVGKTPWRRAWQLIPVFLFGEFPWTEEPGRLQSMGSQRVGYNWVTKYKYFVLHSVLNTSQISVHLKYNTSALCFLHFPFLSLLSLSYNILCKPMDCSQPGSSVPGILQARILEQVAMPSSRRSSRPRDPTQVSCVSCIEREILDHWATHLFPIRERSHMERKRHSIGCRGSVVCLCVL